MKCNEFRDNIASLFDRADSEPILSQLKEHMATCKECRAYYDSMKSTFESLLPHNEPQPSADFEKRLLGAIHDQSAKQSTIRRNVWRLTAGAISIAATLLLVLNLAVTTPVQAARDSFSEAAALFSRALSMRMEVAIRTNPSDNFEYIDPRADFVTMQVETIFSTPNVWRIDKGDRVAMCDGEKYYSWVKSASLGWVNRAYASDNETLLTLLNDPSVILLYEKALTRSQKGASYNWEVRDGVVNVVVTTRAMGDFSQSDYMLNTSILEMNSRREYSFDEESGELLSGKITMLSGSDECTILEIKSIAYDIPLDRESLVALPNGIDFIDMRRVHYGTALQNISAREAAEQIFAAMKVWDKQLLKEACPFFDVELLRDRYYGCTVLEMEESVKSGLYAGEFVPVKVLFSNGEIENLMVALRNDNEQRSWVLDGGV